MIDWPAVIVFDGDTELTYIANQEQWLHDTELHAMTYRDTDVLIDSQGQLFSLQSGNNGAIEPKALKQRIELQRFVRLVQVHAAACGECCIQKISFNNISEGLSLIHI